LPSAGRFSTKSTPQESMATLSLKRRQHRVRRKVITAILVLVVGLGAVGGAYAWRMVDAIVDAEKGAVHPLPPRDDEQVSDIPANETEAADEQPNKDTGDATPAAESDPSDSQLPSGDNPSRFSVIQDLISASVSNGDPGRSRVWGGKTQINIMLLGVDKRPGGGDQNADVIIIARVDLIEQKVAAVSIPRDLLVNIPGIGQDKINSAYNHGVKSDSDSRVAGAALMRDTVESVFGVYIDGYILVDFNGFTEVIDAMGGVTVNVPTEIVDEEYPTEDFGTEVVRFPAGLQRMDGDRALKYVRTRHQDSDDGRRERQLQILRALFDKAKSFGSISNGFNVITALGGSVQTSFFLEQQLTLAQIGYAMDDPDIQLLNLGEPLIWGGYTESGAWVYFSDPDAVRTWVADSLSTDFTTSAVATPQGQDPVASP
jgi:LCP family protein required for cell wall assembly